MNDKNHDTVINQDVKRLYAGDEDDVRYWLSTITDMDHETLRVCLGKSGRILSATEYLSRTSERQARKKLFEERRAEIASFLTDLFSVETSLSGDSLDDLVKESTDKVMSIVTVTTF